MMTSPAAPSRTASRCTRSTSSGSTPRTASGCGSCGIRHGDGKADKDSVFATGFNRYEDGLAAGVLARKGEVYFTCIPDLYLLKDTNGDNKADVKKSLRDRLRRPRAVHRPRPARPLLGPDGKLYFSVGDRGLNVTTKEGKQLFNPDSGAVLRCDLDGSNLEVVHNGLRNPQELAFDDYGNLFTWDNNSDSGDRARWVHIVEGGDSGWRCGYQYGTGYHTPDVPQGNRGPWNTEKLWLPQWEGQAAYIVPPLANFGNGPAGIVHYPGVGLNDKYKDHFFLTDFTGGPGGNSAIWTLSVNPKGASLRGQRAAEVHPPDAADRLRVRTGRGVLLERLDERLGEAEQGAHLPRHRPRGDEEPGGGGGEEADRGGVREEDRRGAGEATGVPASTGAAGSAVRTGFAQAGCGDEGVRRRAEGL